MIAADMSEGQRSHQSPDLLADFRCETTGTAQVPVVVSTEGRSSIARYWRVGDFRYSTPPALNAATTSVRLTNANLRNTCVMCALTVVSPIPSS